MNHLLSCLVAADSLCIALRQRIVTEILAAGYRGISADQALILSGIGDQRYCMTDLTTFRFYRGTNASYNIARMTKTGLITRTRSLEDRRHVFIEATTKGRTIADITKGTLEQYVRDLSAIGIDTVDDAAAVLEKITGALDRLPWPSPAG